MFSVEFVQVTWKLRHTHSLVWLHLWIWKIVSERLIGSVWIINPYLKLVRTWCGGGDSRTDIIRVASVHPLLAPLPASDWSVASLFWPLIGCWTPHLSSPCASVSSYHVTMTTMSSPLPSPCPASIGWGASITASHWSMFTKKSCVIFPTSFLTLLLLFSKYVKWKLCHLVWDS